MKSVLLVVLALLILLSLASGGAKIALLPQEVAFFGGAGFSDTALRIYGSFQLIAGLLLIATKTRLYGSILAALGFVLSTVVIMLGGDIVFGVVSLIPVVMAGFVFRQHVLAGEA